MSLEFIVSHQEAEQCLTNTSNIFGCGGITGVCCSATAPSSLLYIRSLNKTERLFLLHREAKDLAHRVEHVLFCRLVALWIQVLHQESVDHSSVDHELLALDLILDLLDELCCVAFHLVSFSL